MRVFFTILAWIVAAYILLILASIFIRFLRENIWNAMLDEQAPFLWRLISLPLMPCSVILEPIYMVMNGLSQTVRFNKYKHGKIFQAILDGTLVPDEEGRLILPKKLARMTRNGRVYVTHRENDLIMAVFRLRPGDHDEWPGGVLYCNRPLTSEDHQYERKEEPYQPSIHEQDIMVNLGINDGKDCLPDTPKQDPSENGQISTKRIRLFDQRSSTIWDFFEIERVRRRL